MPCRASTSISSVRWPPRASPSARAAATVVLPVPPLPVTTCSRAGQPYPRVVTPSTVAPAPDPARGRQAPLISQTNQPLLFVVTNFSFDSATLSSEVVTFTSALTVADVLSCFSTVGVGQVYVGSFSDES